MKNSFLFFNYFLSVLIFLVVSCSHLSKNAVKSSEISKKLAYFNPDSIGKGRLQIKSTRYLFSYQSIMKDNLWKISMQIPLRGEEILTFSLGQETNLINPDMQLQSEFENQISSFKLDNVTYQETSDMFQKALRVLWSHSLGLNLVCSEVECDFEGQKIKFKHDSSKIILESFEKYLGWTIIGDNFDTDQNIFKKVTLKLKHKDDVIRDLLTLDLFIQSIN